VDRNAARPRDDFGADRMQLDSNAVAPPTGPPPARKVQNKSGCARAKATRTAPSAVTTVFASALGTLDAPASVTGYLSGVEPADLHAAAGVSRRSRAA
jgi:hypothetical protein